jgi:SGNH hydrolase-like domain, acetyltransferase AlgX
MCDFAEDEIYCEQSGAQLIVMFIPFKSQVVLPLLQRSFRDDVLREAFRFYFRQSPAHFDLRLMSRNRLAQNELMRDFCENSGIPLLDLTPPFQENFEAGRNLYFPDDSHWNAAGLELAAAELAKFMRERSLHQ